MNPDDPRVIRTRQQLVQAFNDLVGEKRNFYSIAVQDIANQAGVNRTTFYTHFQDKYDFLEYWKTEKFKGFVHCRLPEAASFNADNLREAADRKRPTSFCGILLWEMVADFSAILFPELS
ncbi:TetR family transcriptional regulator [Paenibacillus sp. HB172176]|uniref:TetR family transcriptional regulator n=1 Tax=Paenibacillus sp. HB172176 TaxID=2493690 RepID=UPI001F0DBE28|nr:TetR family transcriptional regulator [Paenibacillus sp. HB172176]